MHRHSNETFRLPVEEANDTALMAAFDDVRRPFGLLIHGFTDFYPGRLLQIDGVPWMRHAIARWASAGGGGINACAVDWGAISYESFNYFVVSQTNTERVARYLVRVLLRLQRAGIVDLAKTKVAGHSLGAQIAGKVGARLRKHGHTLGFIYGECE